MTVMWWSWGLLAPVHLSKLLGVLGRAALLLHYCLPYIFPFSKGDFYDVAHMLGFLLAITGFWRSAMLTMSLCYVPRNKKLYRCFLHWNRHLPILVWQCKLLNIKSKRWVQLVKSCKPHNVPWYQRIGLTCHCLFNRYLNSVSWGYMFQSQAQCLGFRTIFPALFGRFGRDYVI